MEPYKIARFDRGKIPAGLKREHQLKEGVRAELVVREGSVVFVDHEAVRHRLAEGERIAVATALPHHLEDADEAAIEIHFFRVDDDG